MLCIEGFALEEGQYIWRKLQEVDIDVLEAVWGEDFPADVKSGTVEAKDPAKSLFEWGILTKPGMRTSDGRTFTGPRLNPLEYGYRIATLEVVESLGLKEIDPDAPLRAPSFLHHRPGQVIPSDSDQETGPVHELDLVGVPNLTLSAPPEGSHHKGSNKQKPHIRPQNPS
eukprot:Sspe_Gene.94071::Locus_66541_Transcript_1_1_Confidence_1.000_Length_1675::g.94071::m.94071